MFSFQIPNGRELRAYIIEGFFFVRNGKIQISHHSQNHCLKYINTIEFCANLLENVAEFTGLSEESQQRLSTHLAQLSESEKTKRNLATMLQNGMNAQQGSSAGSGGPRPASLLLADPDQDHWY